MSAGNIIKPISETDIHSITSGQVIVDITSVIKEVLENSLDANSKNIEISLKNFSLEGIEVRDDGDGIKEDDFETLCFKNYTSKLKRFSDLMGMKSLGFRGEALNSLCFISDITVTTCTDNNSGMGYELKYDHNGVLLSKELIPHSKGTTITIENIFKNLPVRHKNFLKNYKKQYNKVVKLIQDYCIINYTVNIKVWNINEKGVKKLILGNLGQKDDTHNNENAINLNKLSKNCSNIFGGQSKLKGVGKLELSFEMPERKSFIKENYFEGGEVICEGLISKTAFGFGRNQKSDNQFIYINKRPVDYPKLQNLINEEYRKFNNLQYPFFVINLRIPTTMLDINVTPDKRTVLVHDELKFFELFREMIIGFWDVDGMALFSNTATKRKIEEGSEESNISSSNIDFYLKSTKLAKLESISAPLSSSQNLSSHESTEEVMHEKCDKNVKDPIQVQETQYESDYGSSVSEKEKRNAISNDENLTTSNVKIYENEVSDIQKDEIVRQDAETCYTGNENDFEESEHIENKNDFEQSEHVENEYDFEESEQVENATTIDPNDVDDSGSKALHSGNIARINKLKAFQSRITSFMNPIQNTHSNCSKNTLLLSEIDSNSKCERDGTPRYSQSDCDEEVSETAEELVIQVDNQKHIEFIPSPRKLTTPTSKRKMLSEASSEQESKDLNGRTSITSKLQAILKESVENDKQVVGINLSEVKENLDFAVADIDIEETKKFIKKSNSNNPGKKRTLYSTNDRIENNSIQEELLTLTVSKKDFLDMKIIGQFNLGFILCTRKLNSGYDMFIIDQHASDEKFNFEQLTRNTIIRGQTLIKPICLELNTIDKLVVVENKKVFLQNGFKLEQREDDEQEEKLYLTTLPLSEKTQFTIEDFYELIGLIKKAESSYKDVSSIKCSKVRSMFAMRACRMSIMIGKPLNITTMKKVVNGLSSLDKPWNCPHGRPTIRHLMELKSYNSFDEDYQL